jgi:hypothetical protein
VLAGGGGAQREPWVLVHATRPRFSQSEAWGGGGTGSVSVSGRNATTAVMPRAVNGAQHPSATSCGSRRSYGARSHRQAAGVQPEPRARRHQPELWEACTASRLSPSTAATATTCWCAGTLRTLRDTMSYGVAGEGWAVGESMMCIQVDLKVRLVRVNAPTMGCVSFGVSGRERLEQLR